MDKTYGQMLLCNKIIIILIHSLSVILYKIFIIVYILYKNYNYLDINCIEVYYRKITFNII